MPYATLGGLKYLQRTCRWGTAPVGGQGQLEKKTGSHTRQSLSSSGYLCVEVAFQILLNKLSKGRIELIGHLDLQTFGVPKAIQGICPILTYMA